MREENDYHDIATKTKSEDSLCVLLHKEVEVRAPRKRQYKSKRMLKFNYTNIEDGVHASKEFNRKLFDKVTIACKLLVLPRPKPATNDSSTEDTQSAQ